jgi:hypothetical protein
MSRSRTARRAALSIVLLMLGFVSLGSGTCVMVQDEQPAMQEDQGENAETMESQEDDVIDESDR